MPDPFDGLGIAQPTLDEMDRIHTQAVNSFFCPICNMGFCRVNLETMKRPYHEWTYTCGHCGVTGTDRELKRNICNMCGRELINGNCQHGCLNNSITRAILTANIKIVPAYNPRPRCPECHNFIDECEHGAPIESMNAEHIQHGDA